MNIVQIGANRGYDDASHIILNCNDIDNLILIEPFEEHNDSLRNCYSNINNLYIENIAIVNDENQTTASLHYHIEDSTHINKFEIASLIKSHTQKIRNHYEDSGMREKTVRSLTLNRLLEKYNIIELDYLFIDTEGFDDKIIYSIDFEKYKIKNIYYEILHVDFNNLRYFLKNKNYSIESNVFYGGWSDLAKLN